jgi:hypothetical protein
MIPLNRDLFETAQRNPGNAPLVIPEMCLLFLVLVALSAFTLLYRPAAINIPGKKIG